MVDRGVVAKNSVDFVVVVVIHCCNGDNASLFVFICMFPSSGGDLYG